MSDNNPMKFPAALCRDAAKALGIGLASGLGAGAVLFGAGALMGTPRLAAGLEAARDGMFLVAALALFVLAGMLLLKGKKPAPSLEGKGWENHFRVLTPGPVLGLLAAAWIAVASVVDYIALCL